MSDAAPRDRTPLWRRLAPFALGIALVGWVLSRIDWPTFVHHLSDVSYPAFIGAMAALLLVLLCVDTLASVQVYRRAVPSLSHRDFFVVRGASYLPSLLNHHVGQAWITWFVSRAAGVDLARMAGATLLIYATWAGCLLLLALIAFAAVGLPTMYLFIALGAGVAYLVLLAVKPRRLAEIRALTPLFEAGVTGHLLAMAFRLPHMAVLFVMTWVPFLFFGVDVPLVDALLYMPLLMVIVTLPLTPLGVGTRDALAAELLSRFAHGASETERISAVAASTTATAVVLVVLEALLGLALLRYATRLMAARQSA